MNITTTTKLHPGISRKEAVRAFYAMRKELELVSAERDKFKKVVDAIGGEWHIPDGVEFPVSPVDVLIIRRATWKNDIVWQDSETGLSIAEMDVIAYRDVADKD